MENEEQGMFSNNTLPEALNISQELNTIHRQIQNPKQYTDKLQKSCLSYVKLGIVVVTIIFLVINAIYAFALPSEGPECMQDLVMDWTTPINNFLNDNEIALNVIEIISSFCIDVIALTGMYFWIFHSKSWRIVVCLAIFYGYRAFNQLVFKMRYPDGWVWHYPGFPSLLVTYERTADFFYSGHVGMPFIFSLEWYTNGFKIPFGICLFCSMVEACVVMFTRTHYFVDIISSLIFSHYFFTMTNKYIHLIDNSRIGYYGINKNEKRPEESKTQSTDDLSLLRKEY